MKRDWSVIAALAAFVACSGDDGSGGDGTTVPSTTDDTGTMTTASATEVTSTTAGTGTGTETDGPKFDVAQDTDTEGDTSPPGPTCKVVDDMDAVGECEESAPPDSFEPDVQWTWTPMPKGYSTVTPMVANLNDDNGDDEIDLCDVPDVVVVVFPSLFMPANLYVLDGETGAEHFMIPEQVDFSVAPALGDIDNDGIPEIITSQSPGGFGFSDSGPLIAFEHDGTVKWTANQPWVGGHIGAIALADLDNDGDVEIIAGNMVADHDGNTLWTAPEPAGAWPATTAADLDGDGDLELVLGHAAYHHDGSLLFSNTDVVAGFPQVANLDADPEPEILVTNSMGLSVIEHDGTTKYFDLRPTGDPSGATAWHRPATVHDFDGDDVSEYAMSSRDHYTVYEQDASIVWSAIVSDVSGIAAGTAFDFIGDGVAEAMYADEHTMFIFDGMGAPLLQTPRSSATGTEYPIVADIDNDGSAEIVVVSNPYGAEMAPTVQVVRDVADRWIQPRRIWNQHTYHVTNVREDGTIPQFENPSWQVLNTFRTNAQIEGGTVCKPDPEG